MGGGLATGVSTLSVTGAEVTEFLILSKGSSTTSRMTETEVTVGFRFFLSLKIILLISALSQLPSSLESYSFSGNLGLGFGNVGMSGMPSNKTFGLESLELIWIVDGLVGERGGGLGWPGLR